MTENQNATTTAQESGPSAGAAAQPENQAAPKPEIKPDIEPVPSTALERDLADMKDRLLRTLAEMENLRKRTEREVADARLYGISAFARDVVAVADNMQRALQAVDEGARDTADSTLKALLDGLDLTERGLMNALEKHGVKKLEPRGQKFDPNRHQAMYEIEDASVPSGSIVQVMQAGYVIGERVLRPALVAVAKGGAKAPQPASVAPQDNGGADSK